jgi:hypothetical protein
MAVYPIEGRPDWRSTEERRWLSRLWRRRFLLAIGTDPVDRCRSGYVVFTDGLACAGIVIRLGLCGPHPRPARHTASGDFDSGQNENASSTRKV